MYPGSHARARAAQPAVIMAGSGEIVTYAELEVTLKPSRPFAARERASSLGSLFGLHGE